MGQADDTVRPAMSVRRRTRFAAWVVTGPAGHLYGGVVDWATLLTRYLWFRARGRDPEIQQ
jgi:hypothetical protein